MSTHETTGTGGLGHVRDGMKVVDSHGEEVGTVDSIRMGDPDAVTASGQDLAAASEDGLPAGTEERLLRVGYLKIDAKGLFAGTRFAAGDEVGQVTGDTVHLTVSKDGLLR